MGGIFATFGHFWSFLLEIALRISYSAETAELFPKIIKMLSNNGKSPTSTGARPPSLTRSGGRRAPVELGHGSTACFPVFGDSPAVPRGRSSAVFIPVPPRSSSYRALASASRGSRGVPGAGPEREEARSLNGGAGRARFGGEEMQVFPRNPLVPPGDRDRDAASPGEYTVISGRNGCVFASIRPNVRPNSPLFPAKSPP